MRSNIDILTSFLKTSVVLYYDINMTEYTINVISASTALGRAAIAVANCGDAEEIGCVLCGHVVEARDPRTHKIKSLCKFFSIFNGDSYY